MKTTTAFVITIITLLGGMVFATFFKTAPYVAFSTTVGIVFSALAGKKLIQKHASFNGALKNNKGRTDNEL